MSYSEVRLYRTLRYSIKVTTVQLYVYKYEILKANGHKSGHIFGHTSNYFWKESGVSNCNYW